MDEIKDAFRGVMTRPVRPIEDREGLRIGEDCRIYKGKKGYEVAFLKGTEEKRRKMVRDKLDQAGVEYTEIKDFKG